MTNSGYRLLPSDNGLSTASYSKKLLDSLVQTDLEPDHVLAQFKNVMEKIHGEPTRIRELNDIVCRMVFIISHFQHTQSILNQEMLNFLKNHQHKMTMTAE